ncbi:MAG TPA: RING finger protein [Candidatus Dependentiae bacterium]|nr:RING finger protein [Candidatus Dependentiae bacterium]HRQ62492.1 RING finger protein [Candidatus Dependentiae bacterium]
MKLKNVLNYSLLGALLFVSVPQVTYGMDVSEAKECGICYEELADGKRLISMPCCEHKQSICFDCLKQWIGSRYTDNFQIPLDNNSTVNIKTTGQPRYTCPMCRKDIRAFGQGFPVDIAQYFNIPIPKPLWVYQLYGTTAMVALGAISYYILNKIYSSQFNSLEYSVDTIINSLVSPNKNWNFDLHNPPFILLGLQLQYDLECIMNSISSDELKVKLENAIKNFDKTLEVVWNTLDKDGYYAKSKVAFMRDKKHQVEDLRAAAQSIKEILSECRTRTSIWKQVLGITALGTLGLGAYVYAQR